MAWLYYADKKKDYNNSAKQKTAKLREKTEDQRWSASLKKLFNIQFKEEEIDLTGLNAIGAIQKLIHFVYIHLSFFNFTHFNHLVQNLQIHLKIFE